MMPCALDVCLHWVSSRECFHSGECLQYLVLDLMDVGWIPASISRAAVGVVLKQPVMAFIASHWIVVKLRTCVTVAAVVSHGRCHMHAA